MDSVRIKTASELSGLPPKTIRFYEEVMVLPPPTRTAAGYRSYSEQDIRRLRLARQLRLLGLPLSETRELVARVFDATCGDLAAGLLQAVAQRRAELDGRLAELEAMKTDLDELEEHLRHAQASVPASEKVECCDFCPVIDETPLTAQKMEPRKLE